MAQTRAQRAVNKLIKALSLEGGPQQGSSSFDGENLYYPTERIYGGQLSAQSIIAAAGTVGEDKVPNSIHESFITVGALDKTTHYEVASLRDGRSFSTRRIDATQEGELLFTATASFQKIGQTGIEFSDSMPENLPAPETLTSAQELMEPYAEQARFAKYYARESPFDIRHIGSTVMLQPDQESAANDCGSQMVWMRLTAPIDASRPIPQTMHRALLAYECDQVMMEPDLRRAGLSSSTPGIFYASIDHSMWWYDDIDMNQWHLYVQDAPVAGHGRALGTARVYRADGRLIAAMTQEATIRVPEQ
ncbi:acyl-CoA thioesterase-2 [Bifidobacterium bohemicum]|uniref:Acyl-CoA thioesterase n=1 Tax=Bifidobacterium bohemicum DSM 22767 TaxID=1437606 RepID=A0A086ZKC5_9BIFI|nr:acyl-CoA thioesterase domain-containing protein [Bifidobacterium bohemicum]KFI46975.1 acyl-CoA thioesterase [Bifidobacterium bohemicum DSM 22767]SCB86702.1 acyl-CoA thioesterase-2 [Bifidobacterium bohemicum]